MHSYLSLTQAPLTLAQPEPNATGHALPSYGTSEASAVPCALPITPGQDAESQVVALAQGIHLCLSNPGF